MAVARPYTKSDEAADAFKFILLPIVQNIIDRIDLLEKKIDEQRSNDLH